MNYKDLINVIKNDDKDAFYYSDQTLKVKDKNYTIRSFSYRLASYTMFDEPFAKELRGTAYYSSDGENWNLFCRAYPKFFNLGELPYSKDLIKQEPQECYQKLDGSLILVGRIDDKLIAKSKTSVNSEQAELANKFLSTHKSYRNFCNEMIDQNKTPVFEFVGPSNVIVLRYPEDTLVLLGTVDNITGKIVTYDELENIESATIYQKTWEELLHIQEIGTPEIEGFVVKCSNELVKIKLLSYTQLHALKDNVTNIKNLTLLILDSNLDDLMVAYENDQDTLDYITKVQNIIAEMFNHVVQTVESEFRKTKHLDRKEFAIANKEHSLFGLIMSKYLGKDVDYKAFFMKNKMYEGIE